MVNAINYPISELENLRNELNAYVTFGNAKYIPNVQQILLVPAFPDPTDYLESFTPQGDYIKPTNIIE